MRHLVTLVTAVSMLTATTAAATVSIAPVPGARGGTSQLSAYAGHVVWSTELATGRWALMTAIEGRTSKVQVPTRESAFDVDLGPGANGHVVAVYSRCKDSSSRACSLYRYDFATKRETHLKTPTGVSEYQPAIWRTRIAFVQRRGFRRQLAVATRRADGHGPTHTLRRIPKGVDSGQTQTFGVDLDQHHVVWGEGRQIKACAGGVPPYKDGSPVAYVTEIRAAPIAGGATRSVIHACSNDPLTDVASPTIQRNIVTYSSGTSEVRDFNLITRGRRTFTWSGGTFRDVARDGHVLWFLRSTDIHEQTTFDIVKSSPGDLTQRSRQRR